MQISDPQCFKHHQNSTRRPQEREERMKFLAGEGKKSDILGGPAEGGPGRAYRGARVGVVRVGAGRSGSRWPGSLGWGWGCHNSGHSKCAGQFVWPNLVLAKVRLAKLGLAKVGHSPTHTHPPTHAPTHPPTHTHPLTHTHAHAHALARRRMECWSQPTSLNLGSVALLVT